MACPGSSVVVRDQPVTSRVRTARTEAWPEPALELLPGSRFVSDIERSYVTGRGEDSLGSGTFRIVLPPTAATTDRHHGDDKDDS
jgi:hypothetical protein